MIRKYIDVSLLDLHDELEKLHDDYDDFSYASNFTCFDISHVTVRNDIRFRFVMTRLQTLLQDKLKIPRKSKLKLYVEPIGGKFGMGSSQFYFKCFVEASKEIEFKRNKLMNNLKGFDYTEKHYLFFIDLGLWPLTDIEKTSEDSPTVKQHIKNLDDRVGALAGY